MIIEKGHGRKRSWTNRDIPEFAWADWGKSRKLQSVWQLSLSKFKFGTLPLDKPVRPWFIIQILCCPLSCVAHRSTAWAAERFLTGSQIIILCILCWLYCHLQVIGCHYTDRFVITGPFSFSNKPQYHSGKAERDSVHTHIIRDMERPRATHQNDTNNEPSEYRNLSPLTRDHYCKVPTTEYTKPAQGTSTTPGISE
jgi:hypothetical protein